MSSPSSHSSKSKGKASENKESNLRSHSELEYRDLLTEYQALRRKLDTKVEALLLVSEELGKCQIDRDSWRQKSESLHHRVLQLEGSLSRSQQEWTNQESFRNEEREQLAAVLVRYRKENQILEEDNALLRQQLKDIRGDTKLLRQQMARIQLGDSLEALSKPSRRSTTSSIGDLDLEVPPIKEDERNQLEEMEKLREQYAQMERDLRSLLCEKEELVADREAFKAKHDRIAQELAFIMNGDERRVVSDVDGILAENRYLKGQLESAHEETGLTRAALNKYRNILDKKKLQKSGVPKPDDSTVVTPKQVGDLLGDHSAGTTDYRSLATALFEAVKDKNLALSHQRKTNKVLGTRVRELEAKVRELECKSPLRVPPSLPPQEPADPVPEPPKHLLPVSSP